MQREITEEFGTDANIELQEFIVSTYAKTFDVGKNKEQDWIYLVYKGNLKGGELKIAEPNKCLGDERYKTHQINNTVLIKKYNRRNKYVARNRK